MELSMTDGRGKEVAPEALAQRLAAGDFDLLRLVEPRFDIDDLVAALERVRRRFPLRSRNNDPTYRGVCLQTCGDTDDPLYGLLNGRLNRGARPTEPTAAAAEFAAVFAALAPHVALEHGRLLEILPGHVMRFHSDGSGHRRLHIPIVTAHPCRFEFEAGDAYHLPADGSCFLVNTELCHRATNDATSPRVHLVFQVRSLAAARDARATPKLRIAITRRAGPPQLDVAALHDCLAGLDWQQANHRYAKAGRLLSRDSAVADEGRVMRLTIEFARLDDLGDFLRDGAFARLQALLGSKGYRAETEIT